MFILANLLIAFARVLEIALNFYLWVIIARAVISWVNGEAFLAVMAGVGSLMTVWAGANTLVRG